LIIHRFPSVSGPGINYILWHLRGKGKIPVICILAKFVTSALALSGTFLAGREGPSFYVGAGIGEWLGKIFKITEKERKYIVLIGAGAFTGALFKAPLGGAIFALEIGYLYDIDYKPFGQTLVASVISYSIFSWFRGMHPFIEINAISVWDLKHIPYLILMGIVASGITYLFVLLYYLLNRISLSITPTIRPIIGTVIAIPLLIFIISISNIHLLSLPVNYTPLTNLI
jgi:H+/Cl- antiporter ClcA